MKINMDRKQIDSNDLVRQLTRLVVVTLIIGGLLYVWSKLFKSNLSNLSDGLDDYIEPMDVEVLESKVMQVDS